VSKKIKTCLDELGMTFDEFIESPEAQDSVVIGICRNKGCDYTTEVEPDCYDGWCEECESNTVRSIVSLMGII
jgi:hypothetical protein